jgi:hypothetical protein
MNVCTKYALKMFHIYQYTKEVYCHRAITKVSLICNKLNMYKPFFSFGFMKAFYSK